MVTPRIELLLARHADTAWTEVIRPWLERGRGRLVRSYVVVATRGQAHGLKQRCLFEEISLLGVEFLSPGLARKKWLAQSTTSGATPLRPALGRELLLLGLRTAVERRLALLKPEDAAWGFWKSLQSDPERALDDFDELLKAGFRAKDFPLAPLREIFGELTDWVESLGYDFSPLQSEVAALTPLTVDAPRIGGRLLVYGLGVESWGEFFNVAAFARRLDEVTVILPEPEFRGRKALDEKWVEIWQALLGAEPMPVAAAAANQSCELIAALWQGSATDESTCPTELLIGKTRADEMQLVADRIADLIETGAQNIGVIFPASDAAHLRLARLLVEKKIPFVDMLETAGVPPVEARAHQALLAFYERGGRLEELLELWPWLRALGQTELPQAKVRDICERLFDDHQAHALAVYGERLSKSDRPEWQEVARIAGILLPVWPAEIALADALKRFGDVCVQLGWEKPASWPVLEVFAQRESHVLPARAVFAALASFLPEKGPAAGVPGRGGFARVTLTTRRRAEGLAWSHLILVEANAGVWPQRRESSCWLTDDQRTELNLRGRFSLGLFTAEDRITLEKRSWATLSRDTTEAVIFSAALFDEEDPELKLAPNGWLERLLWVEAKQDGRTVEQVFEERVREVVLATQPSLAVQAWCEDWQGRRDPDRPFDEYFLSVNPSVIRPDQLAARLIERAIQDPAELWFASVLNAARVPWEPLMRARKKALGQLAHRMLAAVLRTPAVEGVFGKKLPHETARKNLTHELARQRKFWPEDRYWDSFHAELGGMCAALLEKIFALECAHDFVAVEMKLPSGATVPLDAAGTRLSVHGRIDLAMSDRPSWPGSAVEIVDFKTGSDAKLSAKKMARSGASLQLGVYLAAVQSLGAATGRVWMLKPGTGEADSLEMSQLPVALGKLEQVGRHLQTGKYGSLTRDRSEHAAPGFVWPLACVPIPHAVLKEKFAVTFGVAAEVEEAGDE